MLKGKLTVGDNVSVSPPIAEGMKRLNIFLTGDKPYPIVACSERGFVILDNADVDTHILWDDPRFRECSA